MENLKQEAIRVISALPESVNIEEIMYELYVVDKVNKGRDAVHRGESQSSEELKKEILTKSRKQNRGPAQWIMNYKPAGSRSKEEIDQQITNERNSWNSL
ncbi:MAG: hypothetical protein ACOYOE_09865 [Chlorobium sp.]